MNAENFSLMDPDSQPVSGNSQNNGSNVFFLPSLTLEYFHEYRLLIGSGIKDLSGNSLSTTSESSFWTLGNVVITETDEEGIILLHGGTLQMGADVPMDPDALANEGPAHSVTLTSPLYISV